MAEPDADRRMPAAKAKRKAMREPSPAEEGEVVPSHTDTKKTRRKKVREEVAQRGDEVIDVDDVEVQAKEQTRKKKPSAAGSSNTSRQQTSARDLQSVAHRQNGGSAASGSSSRASTSNTSRNTSSAQGQSSSLQSDLASLQADAASMRAAAEELEGVEGERILARIARVEARAEGVAAALSSMHQQHHQGGVMDGFMNGLPLRPQDDSCSPQ